MSQSPDMLEQSAEATDLFVGVTRDYYAGKENQLFECLPLYEVIQDATSNGRHTP